MGVFSTTMAVVGAGAAVAGAGSSIASGLSQNAAAKNASEASAKVSAKSQEISAWTAYFRNKMRDEMAEKLHGNQQIATETEAQLLEFNADSYLRAADNAQGRVQALERRMEFMRKSGDLEAAMYAKSADLMDGLAGITDRQAELKLEMGEEEIGAFRRKLAQTQATAKTFAAYSGVSGIVSKMLFENEIEGEQTARMMRLSTYGEAMQIWGQARAQRIQGMNLRGQGVQSQMQGAMASLQAMEQIMAVDGENTQNRISAIFTRAKAQSTRLGLVYQPPILENAETVAGAKTYPESGWGDIASGVNKGFDATTKLMNYFGKTGGDPGGGDWSPQTIMAQADSISSSVSSWTPTQGTSWAAPSSYNAFQP